jgi:hypothetical protein
MIKPRASLFEWILPAGARRVLGVFIHLVAAVVMTFVAWRASSLVVRINHAFPSARAFFAGS